MAIELGAVSRTGITSVGNRASGEALWFEPAVIAVRLTARPSGTASVVITAPRFWNISNNNPRFTTSNWYVWQLIAVYPSPVFSPRVRHPFFPRGGNVTFRGDNSTARWDVSGVTDPDPRPIDITDDALNRAIGGRYIQAEPNPFITIPIYQWPGTTFGATGLVLAPRPTWMIGSSPNIRGGNRGGTALWVSTDIDGGRTGELRVRHLDGTEFTRIVLREPSHSYRLAPPPPAPPPPPEPEPPPVMPEPPAPTPEVPTPGTWTVSPTRLTSTAGTRHRNSVSVTPSVAPSEAVTLTNSALPAGWTVTAPTFPAGSTAPRRVYIEFAETAAAGTSTITFTGKGGQFEGVEFSVVVVLGAVPSTPPPPSVPEPAPPPPPLEPDAGAVAPPQTLGPAVSGQAEPTAPSVDVRFRSTPAGIAVEPGQTVEMAIDPDLPPNIDGGSEGSGILRWGTTRSANSRALPAGLTVDPEFLQDTQAGTTLTSIYWIGQDSRPITVRIKAAADAAAGEYNIRFVGGGRYAERYFDYPVTVVVPNQRRGATAQPPSATLTGARRGGDARLAGESDWFDFFYDGTELGLYVDPAVIDGPLSPQVPVETITGRVYDGGALVGPSLRLDRADVYYEGQPVSEAASWSSNLEFFIAGIARFRPGLIWLRVLRRARPDLTAAARRSGTAFWIGDWGWSIKPVAAPSLVRYGQAGTGGVDVVTLEDHLERSTDSLEHAGELALIQRPTGQLRDRLFLFGSPEEQRLIINALPGERARYATPDLSGDFDITSWIIRRDLDLGTASFRLPEIDVEGLPAPPSLT